MKHKISRNFLYHMYLKSCFHLKYVMFSMFQRQCTCDNDGHSMEPLTYIPEYVAIPNVMFN